MGTFTYGSASHEVTFDDRLLAHLRAVISIKLRRGECFLFTWSLSVDDISTERSVWMNPSTALSFELPSSATRPLNPQWIEELTRAANSSFGLTPRPEPVAA